MATSASSTCSGPESNQPESLAHESRPVGWCRQGILTRFSGGIEVQHKMTPKRGFWARSICQSIVESTSLSIVLTRIPIICHYLNFEEVPHTKTLYLVDGDAWGWWGVVIELSAIATK